MLYYKSTDTRRIICPKSRKWLDPAFVANELYTEKELRRYCERIGLDFDAAALNCFKKVQISKRTVHWFFGCRFENIDEAY